MINQSTKADNREMSNKYRLVTINYNVPLPIPHTECVACRTTERAIVSFCGVCQRIYIPHGGKFRGIYVHRIKTCAEYKTLEANVYLCPDLNYGARNQVDSVINR